MNHKSDTTRFRFFAKAFVSLAIGGCISGNRGRQVGDKWETSGKTHKTIVKHDFIWGRQEDTKGGKKKYMRETKIKSL